MDLEHICFYFRTPFSETLSTGLMEVVYANHKLPSLELEGLHRSSAISLKRYHLLFRCRFLCEIARVLASNEWLFFKEGQR
jgi:hypothetical protein